MNGTVRLSSPFLNDWEPSSTPFPCPTQAWPCPVIDCTGSSASPTLLGGLISQVPYQQLLDK